MSYRLTYSDYAPTTYQPPAPSAPGEPAPLFAMTVPYMRTSCVHMPRRDLVLASADSFVLIVTVVDYNNASGVPITITGGIGGPSAKLVIWPDATRYGWGWGAWGGWWDYGMPWTLATEPLLSIAGTPVVNAGAFSFSFPSGTMARWPLRCFWCVQLNYGEQGVTVLAAGTLHVRRMAASAFQLLTGGLLTDDYIPVHTDVDQQVFT